jgi:hypothetical protein
MRAAALAAAVIAGFLGVMYVRFSGDTVPAPPTPQPYAAGQPTCVAFRLVSQEDSEPDGSCGAIGRAVQPSPSPPSVRVLPLTTSYPRQVFARVVNTEGTCLNIRAEPGPAGQVLACEAEGVMLEDLLEGVYLGGITWERVRTPAGIEGWASEQYLER